MSCNQEQIWVRVPLYELKILHNKGFDPNVWDCLVGGVWCKKCRAANHSRGLVYGYSSTKLVYSIDQKVEKSPSMVKKFALQNYFRKAGLKSLLPTT